VERFEHCRADSVAHACHMSRRSLFRLFADAPLSLADELYRAFRSVLGTSLTSYRSGIG
jgi:hypothetical protein